MRHARLPGAGASEPYRPIIGVLCCNEVADRAIQAVASRFVEPLTRFAEATVLLVPALPEITDIAAISRLLDGLLLTGSRSHVSPDRYGGGADTAGKRDPDRDEVALSLSDRMIEAGKPVFGICRGLQELNVLFGGSLRNDHHPGRHHLVPTPEIAFADLFENRHEVSLTDGGRLAVTMAARRLTVNSVHEQIIDRLGAGLEVEAICDEDAVVEAVSARPCGGDVIAVQWHPEWDAVRNPASRVFFRLIGESLRTAPAIR